MSHNSPTQLSDDSSPHGRSGGDPKFDGTTIDDSRIVGKRIRYGKYSVVHQVTTAYWTDASEEVHIFEPRNNKDKRFLQKNVLPKLRKPWQFVKETELGDGIFAIICRVPEGPAVNYSGNTSTSKSEKEPQEPASSQLPLQAADISNTVYAIYFAYCSRNHKTVPCFKGYSLSTGSMAKSRPTEAREGWDPLVEASRAVPKHDPFRALELKGRKVPAEAESVNEDGQRLENPQAKKRPRALPQDRDLHLIWDLAEMISKEPNLITSTGKYEPGHSFFQRHLSKKVSFGTPPRSVIKAIVEKQKQWMGRLRRATDRIPGFLERYKSIRGQTWRLGAPLAEQLFASNRDKRDMDQSRSEFSEKWQEYWQEMPTVEHETAERITRWMTNLDWMIEHNFQGFTQADVDALKKSLRIGYDDVVLSWMRRLISHIRQRAWALGAGRDETQEPILMDMIVAFTSHEIILGMAPLVEIMLEVAGHELGRLESMETVDSTLLEKDRLFKLRWEDCFELMPPTQQPYYAYGSRSTYGSSGSYASYGGYGYYRNYPYYGLPFYAYRLQSGYGSFGTHKPSGGHGNYGSPTISDHWYNSDTDDLTDNAKTAHGSFI